MLDPTEAATVGDETDAATRPRAVEWPPGSTLGRYVVLGRVGAGAMGIVYAAYDPELDRRVAIKCLPSSEASADQRTRLVREAQALAKLSHPNAVAVHDAGTHDDTVWLAMELVEGQTLDRWLQARLRHWSETLAVLRDVACGVAAAHDAGIVHRDVKPSNVMIGDDGRTRVMDFGLARAGDRRDVAPSDDASGSSTALGRSATQLGATPGTPAYMAPEQHAGVPADARSDQFAFCVTAWEALYGARPFGGASAAEVAANVIADRRRAPPGDARVPRWLRRILDRGLAASPHERWPSMAALLAAIDDGQRAARRIRGLVIAGAVVLVVGASWSIGAVRERAAAAACDDAGAAITSTWGPEVAARVRDRLHASGVAFAATTADHVTPWLDDYAAQWHRAVAASCLAAQDNDEAPTLVDAQQWCFARRRDQLADVVESLLEPDVQRIQRALDAVTGLESIHECSDRASLSRMPVPPASQRDEIAALTREISRLRGRPSDAEAERDARGLLARAEALGWAPLVARAQSQLGWVLSRRSDHAGAEKVYEPAFFTAAAAGDLTHATQIADLLTTLVGDELARPEEGLRWNRVADLVRASTPDPGGVLASHGLATRAVVLLRTGDFAQARAELERAIASLEDAAPGHPAIGRYRGNLAIALAQQGELDAASTAFEAARTAITAALGDGHPELAQLLHNQGNVEVLRGRPREGLILLERALEIREGVWGPDHVDVASTLHAVGTAHLRLEDVPRAAAAYERALAGQRRWLGEEHPDTAGTMHNLALIAKRRGDHAGALQLHRRALEIQRKRLGDEHPAVARAEVVLGETLEHAGQYDAAREAFTASIAALERRFGARHLELAAPLRGLVRVSLAARQPHDALAAAKRLNDLEGLARRGAHVVAEAQLLLARSMSAASPDDTDDAVAIARAALVALRAADPSSPHVAKIEAWLAAPH